MWLLDHPMGFTREQVMLGFDAARQHLGDDWPERHCPARGALAALPIIADGLTLKRIEHLAGFDRILRRLRTDVRSTRAEAEVIAALAQLDLDVEIEPRRDRRMPDARAKWRTDWIYVEIAQPTYSEQLLSTWRLATDLAHQAMACLPQPGRCEIELLRRFPLPDIGAVLDRIRRMREEDVHEAILGAIPRTPSELGSEGIRHVYESGAHLADASTGEPVARPRAV